MSGGHFVFVFVKMQRNHQRSYDACVKLESNRPTGNTVLVIALMLNMAADVQIVLMKP